MNERHKFACLDDGGPSGCTCAEPEVRSDVICCHRGAGWHRSDVISCDLWDLEAEAAKEPVHRNGHGYSDDEHEAYQGASPDGEPIEGTAHYPRSPKPQQMFAEAVTHRYQQSLWSFLPNEDQMLADRKALRKIALGAARRDLWFHSVMVAIQLFMAIFVTAHAKEPGSFGVKFCWGLVLLWGLFWISSYRSWRKAVAACTDLG
jgi:hypothetical protein